MEEKERYEQVGYGEIRDNQVENSYNLTISEIVNRLNQQDKENKKLCQQIIKLNKENNKLLKFKEDILRVQAGPYQFYKENQQLKEGVKEKEKLIERLQGVIDKLRDKKFAGKILVEAVNAVYEPLFKNKCDEVEELKQQLKSQPAEIMEKIRNLAEKDFDFDTCTCCGEDVHDDVVLPKSDFNKIIDKVLKKYQEQEGL